MSYNISISEVLNNVAITNTPYTVSISEVVNNVAIAIPAASNIAITSPSYPITISYNAIITSGGGGGGLENVVEDTSPQLGGNLDMNGKQITGHTVINLGNDFFNGGAGGNALDITGTSGNLIEVSPGDGIIGSEQALEFYSSNKLTFFSGLQQGTRYGDLNFGSSYYGNVMMFSQSGGYASTRFDGVNISTHDADSNTRSLVLSAAAPLSNTPNSGTIRINPFISGSQNGDIIIETYASSQGKTVIKGALDLTNATVTGTITTKASTNESIALSPDGSGNIQLATKDLSAVLIGPTDGGDANVSSASGDLYLAASNISQVTKSVIVVRINGNIDIAPNADGSSGNNSIVFGNGSTAPA